MLKAATLVAALLFTQQPAPSPAGTQEVPVLRAGLGPCSASFTVTGTDGMPAYAAIVRTRVRYGMMSMKRMDLEVSTDAQGRALIQGLPKKAKPLSFAVQKGNGAASVTQDLKTSCEGNFSVVLK